MKYLENLIFFYFCWWKIRLLFMIVILCCRSIPSCVEARRQRADGGAAQDLPRWAHPAGGRHQPGDQGHPDQGRRRLRVSDFDARAHHSGAHPRNPRWVIIEWLFSGERAAALARAKSESEQLKSRATRQPGIHSAFSRKRRGREIDAASAGFCVRLEFATCLICTVDLIDLFVEDSWSIAK